MVIPVYNEADCLFEVVSEWVQCFRDIEINFQIILINDGSTDNTKSVLDELKNTFNELIVIHQKNSGHGPTIHRGYVQAIQSEAKWVFQVDSDNQFCPDDFCSFWENRNQANFVLGMRTKRYDPLHRLIISRFLRLCLFIIFQVKIFDSNTPYRLIRNDFLSKNIQQIPESIFAPNIFLSILARKTDPNFLQIPIIHKERETGEVSIVRLKLLSVCFKSFLELVFFRLSMNKKIEAINA